ncbi:LysR family transcriptional regulator [Rugamonas sp.]|uniref:LysR family transcriptional regulator n=1 Tax=Rugamonas sp. TaxID=1926287 RepID=UPI0025D21B2C|nr:LysR family transcriptional regulator [Rugamonas sp.]
MDRLEAMRVFCAVVETGGFSRAAGRLGLSTSSVTKQVLALEAHFRVKLLNRTTRSMSLTDEGRRCHARALALLADMAALEGSLHDAAHLPRGSLRVDLPGIVSRLYVAPALPRFLAAYPDIALRMTAGDRLIDMVEDGVDVLVRIGALADTRLIARSVCRTRYVCCASPDFLRRHGAPQTPAQLADFTCLNFLYPQSGQLRPWRFQRDGQLETHTPRGAAAIDHVDTLIAAAVAGAGIVQQLSLSLAAELRSGALVPVLQPWQAAGPDVSVLVQHQHHRTERIRVFVDFIARLFADQRPG